MNIITSSSRNIDGHPLAELEFLVIEGDQCITFHDNPVLGSIFVSLQA